MQQEIWFQKYRILGLLGKGGTSKVYLAEHIKLNSYRAIKFISKNHPLYELQHKEAFILKDLKHSCIPIIYDIEENEEGSYIVEQYLEGDTLKDYVGKNGALREDIIILFAVQLCDLIHYLHSTERPILYLDLKPENIILIGMTLKLIDFGSALYQDEMSENRNYYGTRGFAAPELYRHKKIDERCDIYGIGSLLYYMAAGHEISENCFDNDNIDLLGNYSKRLKNIMNHCLKFNPSERYTSVGQLSKQLSAMLGKQKVCHESSQLLTIAVAGAQPRIGVTHLSFRLCNYFIQQNRSCLYIERNDTECVRRIKNCYEKVEDKNGIYVIESIPMLRFTRNGKTDIGGYRITVTDYGNLTKENISEFLNAKVKLLLLGAKDWELKYAEEALNMVAEYKEIAYLFNFTSGRLFQRIARSMEKGNSYRVPYEPDPFAKVTDENEKELFDELLCTKNKTQLADRLVEYFQKKWSYL